MSSSAERGILGVLMACFAIATLPGCYDSHLCEDPEVCDYLDQNCNHLVDEDFRDDAGVYVDLQNCGVCGVSCPEIFPTAAETQCVADDAAGTARCRIVACAEGFHLAGDGSCAPDAPAACLPCTEDADCGRLDPSARCLELVPGDRRCIRMDCTGGCPTGYRCDDIAEDLPACVPTTGECACTEETLGLEQGCLLTSPMDGHECAGTSVCEADGFSACAPALSESCNLQDDNCDGQVDEDFRDDAGLYVSPLHCGACARPCTPPGPNMVATCTPDASGVDGVRCDKVCEPGFVDVNGILADGCECERFDGSGPPPVVGGDSNCDGLPDDTADFIYVTTTGSDTNPGTLARPMRNVQAALRRGQATAKDVLVARGIYDGAVDLVSGVSLFGGYRPDFRDRDLTLFPVVLEHRGARPGTPVLTCHDVHGATRVEGFEIDGSDATRPGDGSSSVYFDGCDANVTLAELTIVSGRGADGVRGLGSSDHLADIGFSSLAELDGVSGGNGSAARDLGTCPRVRAGVGGAKTCASGLASGGNGGDGMCPDIGCTNGSPCGNAGCEDFTSGGVCDFAAVLRVAVPNPAATPGRGAGGGEAGELTYAAPTDRGVCNFCDDNPTLPRLGGTGGDGAIGTDGSGGLGCAAPPALDASRGVLHAESGGGGTAGADASGGGGGTAGAGYAVIGGTSGTCADHAGGAGGGGGSGGCGAPRADGGTGGGVSAGLVVRLAASGAGPMLTNVRVVTSSGGEGGAGGGGATGGAGGGGGLGGGAEFWCSRSGGRGGDGGRGGAAGGGGGGCGGGTHAAVVLGSAAAGSAFIAASRPGVTVERVGVPGRGGAGGFSPIGRGTDGTSGSDEDFFLLSP